MAHKYMSGIYFLVGLVAGLVISVLVTNYSLLDVQVMKQPLVWNKRTLLENQSNEVLHPKDTALRFSSASPSAAAVMGSTPTPGTGTGTTESPPTAAAAADGDTAKPTTPTPIIIRAPITHREVAQVDAQRKNRTVYHFDDSESHDDDTHLAEELFDKVRIFCWVMTAKNNHKSKAVHVKATWGKRCNYLYFMSDGDDPDLPAVDLKVDLGRDHLTAKTMKAFDFAYNDYLDKADWFLKADDDTYVIVENLRYMLTAHQPTEPVYFGHHFKVIVEPQGYFSGGGGYVLSREALRRFGERPDRLCKDDSGAEDVEIGACMQNLGVFTGDGRDKYDRSRFHCFNPQTHLEGGYPDWYYSYDKYGAKKGKDHMSDYPITFHYVTTNEMYNLEYFVYHLRPYGIISKPQDLNRHDGKTQIEAANGAAAAEQQNHALETNQVLDNSAAEKNS